MCLLFVLFVRLCACVYVCCDTACTKCVFAADENVGTILTFALLGPHANTFTLSLLPGGMSCALKLAASLSCVPCRLSPAVVAGEDPSALCLQVLYSEQLFTHDQHD